jgi:hypothetical protein
MAFLSDATGRDRRSGGPTNASMASATSALRMRGADVDYSRISVRAVRSHNPSRKATVGSVAPSHLAPCLTRWRREGWHRLRNPLDNLGICPCFPLSNHGLEKLNRAFELLVGHCLHPAGMLQLHLPRHQQDKQFQKYRRLVPHHLLYRLAAVATEGGVHFPDGVGVQRMTRAMDVAVAGRKGTRGSLRKIKRDQSCRKAADIELPVKLLGKKYSCGNRTGHSAFAD